MAGNRDPRRGGAQPPRKRSAAAPPSGRRPSRPSLAVYRRRRLAVTLAAVLVIVLVSAAGIALTRVFTSTAENAARSEAGSAASEGTATASPADPAAPPETAAADGQSDGQDGAAEDEEPARSVCPDGTVSVEASTDSPVYAAGTSPLLRLSVTNTGAEPCEINVGTSQMEFLVTSGSDRIFSSADCQDGGEDLWKEFEPGAVETAVMPWDRVRTSPGCTPVPSNPAPGYYVLTASLGGLASPKAVFELE